MESERIWNNYSSEKRMKIIFDIKAVDGKIISIQNKVELLAKIGEMVAEAIDTDADIKWIIEVE